jgi:formyltetrahydrofolate synthetase
LLKQGICNLQRHIRISSQFGIPVVVSINKFDSDTSSEISLIMKEAKEAGKLPFLFFNVAGAQDVVVSTNWQEGSAGAIDLAKAVARASEGEHKLRLLYEDHQSLKEKIELISKAIYGAGEVSYSPLAEKQIQQFVEQGKSFLPQQLRRIRFVPLSYMHGKDTFILFGISWRKGLSVRLHHQNRINQSKYWSQIYMSIRREY